MTSIPLRTGAGALALALVLAACGATPAAQPVMTNQVDLPPSYLFSPALIQVAPGTTVSWTNHDNFTHSVRLIDLGGQMVGIMHPGQSVRFTFDRIGTYHYDCSFHPQSMKGTVIVTGT